MSAKRRPRRRQKNTATTLTAAERRVRAVQLRQQGKTFAEIGAELGITAARAHQIIHGAIDHLNALLVGETAALRQRQLDRVEALTAALWKVARQSKGGLGAVDRLVKLMEREAKLAGLDAAKKFEHSGPNGGPIDLASVRQRVEARIAALASSTDEDDTAPMADDAAEPDGEDGDGGAD